jgi:L-lactate dehydrogenase complex protein LldG
MSAREQILGRIRDALVDVPPGERPDDVTVPRDYCRHDERTPAELVERFAERLRDYRATVRTVIRSDLSRTLSELCAELGLERLVIPPGLSGDWVPNRVTLVQDDGLSAAELDAIDGALTGCACAIADTGTIVLDGAGACGRRAITLVPDHHLCVVFAEQIVGIVPEAFAKVASGVIDERRPITLISGPSATSDIELIRVEGVHGPRHLVVVIVTDGSAGVPSGT